MEQMKARLAQLEAVVAAKNNGRLTFKVSEKGVLSVYGLQRFPVSLYVDQWERLISAVPAIQEFAKVNAAGLKRKSEA
jgi:hypothetical protein